MAGGGGEIMKLPEGCISHVISLTSPRDCCRLAAVSPTFQSAADSDAVWDRFLPPDYEEILSRAVDPVVFTSKKDLYFRLCDSILIDNGKMSFRLERTSGRKCFMLSARGFQTVWASCNRELDRSDDNPDCLKWDRFEGSRFPEVAELLDIRFWEIRGSINSKGLSRKTTYAAYLVFKVAEKSFYPINAEASVTLGSHVSEHTVCLHTEDAAEQSRRLYTSYGRGPRIRLIHTWTVPRVVWRAPQSRADGWMETEVGEFFNYDGGDGNVEMCLLEIKDGRRKGGLIVEGIEVRPKQAASSKRFPEVAELLDIRFWEICGSINSKVLSRKTTYAAYLVFKVAEKSFYPINAEASVTLGSHVSEHTICLHTEDAAEQSRRLYRSYGRGPRIRLIHTWTVPRVVWRAPQSRADGWMETEVGEFFNYDGGDGNVEMCLPEIKDGRWKGGLIVEGIEVRPK